MKKFSQINSVTLNVAIEGHIIKRKVKDIFSKSIFAQEKSSRSLDYCLYKHQSLIRRQLGVVDSQLQDNKAINLTLASKAINTILIKPGETFSLWKLAGRHSKRNGYKVGLTITGNKPTQGIGGGLCQLTNLIHWLVLHSPLEIVEHHHHDQFDLFPDYNRQVPFGVGTSIQYNYLDYRFKNTTNQTFQLCLWTDNRYLYGQLMCEYPLESKYHIEALDEYFMKEDNDLYRYGKIYRKIIDKETGATLKYHLVKDNRAIVLYDHNHVPSEKIKI